MGSYAMFFDFYRFITDDEVTTTKQYFDLTIKELEELVSLVKSKPQSFFIDFISDYKKDYDSEMEELIVVGNVDFGKEIDDMVDRLMMKFKDYHGVDCSLFVKYHPLLDVGFNPQENNIVSLAEQLLSDIKEPVEDDENHYLEYFKNIPSEVRFSYIHIDTKTKTIYKELEISPFRTYNYPELIFNNREELEAYIYDKNHGNEVEFYLDEKKYSNKGDFEEYKYISTIILDGLYKKYPKLIVKTD